VKHEIRAKEKHWKTTRKSLVLNLLQHKNSIADWPSSTAAGTITTGTKKKLFSKPETNRETKTTGIAKH